MPDRGLIKGNEKILIIQFRPVGDILLTAPVAEYLKKKFPDIKITFLVFEHFHAVLKHNPFIDDVLKIRKVSRKGLLNFFRYVFYRLKVIREIRKNKYDIVLDYIGLPSSAIIAFLSGAKYKVGYGDLPGRGLLYNKKAPRSEFKRYAVANKYNLLVPLGISEDAPLIKTRLYLSVKDRKFAENFFNAHNLNDKFTVLFSPDSPRIYKKWSMENYRELGLMLANGYKAKILILHGPGEKEYCRKLEMHIGSSAILLPETSILEAAAVIQRASLAVLNCGGMKHISVAVSTPSITIFGSTSHINWHPPGLEWAGYLQGSFSGGDNSFGIYPKDALKKVDDFIRKGLINSLLNNKEFF